MSHKLVEKQDTPGVKLAGLAIVSILALLVVAAQTGCVTTKSSKGFQTNPPVASSNGFPHSFDQADRKNPIQKFFGAVTGQNKKSPVLRTDNIPPERDATSLQSKGTISPELLIVAGEMAVRQNRLEQAVTYFERALQIDPGNLQARQGLAVAEEKRGNRERASEIRQAIQKRRAPLNPDHANSDAISSPKISPSRSQILQVAYQQEEESRAHPPAIALEDTSTDQQETVLHPQIEVNLGGNPQRFKNPFFGKLSIPRKLNVPSPTKKTSVSRYLTDERSTRRAQAK